MHAAASLGKWKFRRIIPPSNTTTAGMHKVNKIFAVTQYQWCSALDVFEIFSPVLKRFFFCHFSSFFRYVNPAVHLKKLKNCQKKPRFWPLHETLNMF